MSRSKFIIIGIITTLIVGAGVWFLYNQSINSSVGEDGERKGIFSFFPFGNRDGGETPVDIGGEEIPGEETTPELFIPKLRQLSFTPTAGAIAFERKATSSPFATTTSATSTETVVRFMERATGHIFEIASTQLTTTRISNVTIPQLYTVLFGPNGESFIGQRIQSSNDVVDTIYGKLSTATTSDEAGNTVIETRISQKSYPSNIKQVVFNSARTRAFYLVSTFDLGIINSSALDATGITKIFESPLREWLLQFTKTDSLLLTTKPHSTIKGSSYLLNSTTKAFDKILADISGLTALANTDATYLLYSQSDGTSFNLYTYNVAARERQLVPFKTLPEKCVWSTKNKFVAYCAIPLSLPRVGYPESWYQGNITFSDYLWKFDFSSGEYTTLLKPEEVGGPSLDITDLFLNDKETAIFFTNKKDYTLWSYSIEQ